jgi:hypothetical protein
MVTRMLQVPPRLILAATLLAALCAAAPGLAQKPAPARPAAKAAEPPPPPVDQMKTSDQVKRESVEGAATAPLRDLNVVRTKIPDILLATLADPYARPPRGWKCPQLANLIRPLDQALGPDLDLVPAGDENLMDRSRSTALGVAADLASGAIPFRGWVRKLSGAESHDKLVQSAIIAGNLRRGYLKGLGEARGCMPPATPSHERAGTPPVVETRKGPIPHYPIRPSEPAAQQTRPGTPGPAPGR